MKTKMMIAGVLVAIVASLSVKEASAQTAAPAVKVIPTSDKDVIKLIYGYDAERVDIKFSDASGIIASDRVKGKSFEGGFNKKYRVERNANKDFWIEVSSADLAVTYRMTAGSNGKWMAQLEKTTYNYPVVASK